MTVCPYHTDTFLCNNKVFARFALRRNPVELARMKKHSSEQFFGVQIATNQISEGVNAGLLAYQNGADFRARRETVEKTRETGTPRQGYRGWHSHSADGEDPAWCWVE